MFVPGYVPLTRHELLSRFHSRWARIISGADEGVYGWIALNYMTGHLASNPILAADQGLEGTADEPIAVTSALTTNHRVCESANLESLASAWLPCSRMQAFRMLCL